MTTRDKKMKEREWLRARMFAITASLKDKLDKTHLDETEQRRLCGIQSTVLGQMAYHEKLLVSVPREMLQQAAGSNYLSYVAQLAGWEQLDGDRSYLNGTNGWAKSFWIPKPALASGVIPITFLAERTPRRKPQTTAPDEVSQYALSCLQQLRTPVELVLPPDPVAEFLVRDHFIGIFFGDFEVRYGDKSNRLYHRVIDMPREGRRNLLYWEPLYDFDVRTCLPVLLLPLLSDPEENKRYRALLDSDIYNAVLAETGMGLDRDALKKEFAKMVNTRKRLQPWFLKHPILGFFQRQFPRFTKDVLLRRGDLARYSQGAESSMMVQELGQWCKQQGAYWIPQHDGFLSTLEHGKEIEKRAVQLFEERTGYSVRMTCTSVLNIE